MEVALPSAAAAIKGAEDQPVDGRTLSDTLHAHGVNLRYLGKVRFSRGEGGGDGVLTWQHFIHLWK